MRWFCLTFVACLLVTVLRNTLVITAPLLFWDDVIIFNDFYNNGTSLFAVYPDYVSWAPNIIFSAVFHLFKTQDLSVALEAVTIAVYGAFTAFFSLPMFDAVVADPKKRVLLCLWVAVMPITDQSLIEIAAYQNCSCMIPLFLATALIVSAALTKRRGPHPAWLALLVPCALANPLLVCTAPLNAASALLRFRRDGSRAALMPAALALAGLAAAALVGVTASRTGGRAPVDLSALAAAGWRSLLFLLDRGFVEALIGSPARQTVLDALPPLGPGLAPAWLYGAALALTALGVAAAWRWSEAPTLWFSGALLLLALGYSVLALVSLGPLRGLANGSPEVLTTLGRYWFIQKVGVLVALGTVLANSPAFAPGSASAPPRWWASACSWPMRPTPTRDPASGCRPAPTRAGGTAKRSRRSSSAFFARSARRSAPAPEAAFSSGETAPRRC